MISPLPLPNRNMVRVVLGAGMPVALLLIFLSLVPGPARASGVIHVDADAAGSATGLSWTDAYTNVQDALAAAVSGDQVWVAAGVYYPDEGGGGPNDVLTATFTLANAVALYGGFAGSETELGQRDPALNVTVLSGDVDRNDSTDPNGVVTDTADIVGANAYHVVTGGGTDGSAVLDGFTITGGQANGSPVHNRGGGMYNDGSNATLAGLTFSGNSASNGGGMYNEGSSPALTDAIFSGNSAGSGGGGMSNTNGSTPALTGVTFISNGAFQGGGLYNTNGSSATLTDVSFISNTAGSGGGGMSNNAVSSPTLTDVTFNGNDAGVSGGGMANNLSSPTLTNVNFIGNSATANGGGMFNSHSNPALTDATFSGNGAAFGGGMANIDGSGPTLTNIAFNGNIANFGGGLRNLNSNPALINVTFSGNSANFDGGGMANTNVSSTLTNVTFSGNSATDSGGGMANSQSNPTLINVIMWGDTASNGPEIYDFSSTPAIAYSDIQGCGGSGGWNAACGTDNGDNIDADPLFVDPDGADDTVGTLDDDLRLRAGSPAIDAGDINNCPPTDLDGMPRPIDGDGDSQADCDMGAFEYQIPTTTIILSDDPDPSPAGERFTVTVSVTAAMGTPTGGVTVTVSGDPGTCSEMLSGGMGGCALTLWAPGTYTLTATYGGDGAFSPSSASEPHTVVPQATTTTILSDAPDPSQPGEPFTVTFAVSGTLLLPTGAVTITVSDDPASCSDLLSGGMGSCSLALAAPGTYTLTATYAGGGTLALSSDTETHTVETTGFTLYLPLVRRN